MNFDLVRRLGAAFTFLLASSLVAQSISVSPSSGLTAGGSATVSVNDPSKAGNVVYVNITSQGTNPLRSQVAVTLNAAGVGEASWPVPASGWSKAYFNYTDGSQVIRLVQ